MNTSSLGSLKAGLIEKLWTGRNLGRHLLAATELIFRKWFRLHGFRVWGLGIQALGFGDLGI